MCNFDMVTGIFVYLMGFILSFLTLGFFGSALGLDYSSKYRTDKAYDDYASNNQAYLSFSTVWPIFWFLHIIILLCKGLGKLGSLIVKD